MKKFFLGALCVSLLLTGCSSKKKANSVDGVEINKATKTEKVLEMGDDEYFFMTAYDSNGTATKSVFLDNCANEIYVFENASIYESIGPVSADNPVVVCYSEESEDGNNDDVSPAGGADLYNEAPNTKAGLFSLKDGKWIIEAEYTDIQQINYDYYDDTVEDKGEMYFVCSDENYNVEKIVDSEGNQILKDVDFTNGYVEYNDGNFLVTSFDEATFENKVTAYDKDGKEVDLGEGGSSEKYDCGDYYQCMNEDGTSYITDMDGNIILNAEMAAEKIGKSVDEFSYFSVDSYNKTTGMSSAYANETQYIFDRDINLVYEYKSSFDSNATEYTNVSLTNFGFNLSTFSMETGEEVSSKLYGTDGKELSILSEHPDATVSDSGDIYYLSEDKNTIYLMDIINNTTKSFDVTGIDCDKISSIADGYYAVSSKEGSGVARVYKGDELLIESTGAQIYQYDDNTIVFDGTTFDTSDYSSVPGKLSIYDMDGNAIYESTGNESLYGKFAKELVVVRSNHTCIIDYDGNVIYQLSE